MPQHPPHRPPLLRAGTQEAWRAGSPQPCVCPAQASPYCVYCAGEGEFQRPQLLRRALLELRTLGEQGQVALT